MAENRTLVVGTTEIDLRSPYETVEEGFHMIYLTSVEDTTLEAGNALVLFVELLVGGFKHVLFFHIFGGVFPTD